MPGPAPTPTSLKKLRGNPGKRPLRDNEPRPGEFCAEPPKSFDKTGIAEWFRITAILKPLGLLTEADYLALETLCWSYQLVCRARRQLAKEKLRITSESGWSQANALLGIINQQTAVVNKMMAEFGMTPASRSRISVPPEKPKANKFAALAEETNKVRGRPN